ncbi:hypothetical protein, partial [uncultured Ornithinimicrobium sp.]|uniref:hypothetical protein n=1 Tax=uncultured Ornithinimicrobium sp. TaxID=259307 RepID=UPI0025912EFA
RGMERGGAAGPPTWGGGRVVRRSGPARPQARGLATVPAGRGRSTLTGAGPVLVLTSDRSHVRQG